MPTSTRPTRKSSRLSSPVSRSPIPQIQSQKGRPRSLFEDGNISGASSSGDGKELVERADVNIKRNASVLFKRWHEPPVLNRPSFEDHGFERLGVLSTMVPLGSRPTAKVKAKIRNDMERRLSQAQSAAASEAEEPDRDAFDTTRGVDSLQAEPLAATPAVQQNITVKAESDDVDYVPAKTDVPIAQPTSNNSTLKAPAKPDNKSSPSRPLPTSRTSTGRQRLEAVVEAAVHKSREVGNPGIGLAIKQIFVESLHNDRLGELLDAILAQKTTQEQTKEFQSYVKKAKKALKAHKAESKGRAKQTTIGNGVIEKPPKQAESSRPTTITTSEPIKEIKNQPKESSPNRSSRRLKSLEEQTSVTDGLRKEPVRKEMSNENERTSKKRSSSTSSVSSLSSIESSEECLQYGNGEISSGSRAGDPAKVSRNRQPITDHRVTLPLGNTKANKSKSKQMSSGNNSDYKQPGEKDPSGEDDAFVESRRQKLRESQTFSGYHVKDSHLRRSSTNKRKRELSRDRATSSSNYDERRPVRTPHTEERQLRNGHPQRNAGVSPARANLNPSTSFRSATPDLSGPPLKKAKSAARIKMSPQKNRIGIIAGIAHLSQGAERRGSPTCSDNSDKSNNNDFCSACSGSGYLLCCDGCDRSFHFTCCDPPLSSEADALEEPWFCQICEAKTNPPSKPSHGFFPKILYMLEKMNPSSFALPQSIRECYEGVRTGTEGEYEEVTFSQKPRNKSGYDELPDLRKLKDAKGNPVLCSQCNGSSLDKRPIIACDYCPSQFHLDCLDPPLANPPSNGQNGKKNMWMCPRHADHDLRVVDPRKGGTNSVKRIHRTRRPKNPKFVDVAFYRGFKNNGCIEIDNDVSEDEFYEDESASGVIYRLPEKGIKLEFISKVKLDNATASAQPQQLGESGLLGAFAPATSGLRERPTFDGRPFNERKAALNLAQLAQKHPSLGLGPDRVESLVNVLIAESPDEVAAAITAAESTAKQQRLSHPSPPLSDQHSEQPISDVEKMELLALQELIRKRLDRFCGGG